MTKRKAKDRQAGPAANNGSTNKKGKTKEELEADNEAKAKRIAELEKQLKGKFDKLPSFSLR